MIIRFSEKDLAGNSYIPVGEHEVVVAKIEEQDSKQGEKMLVVHVRDRMLREAKEYFVLTEKALWKLAGFAIACGIDKEELAANGLNVSKLMGSKLIMIKKQTGVRMYDGKEVKDYSNEYFRPQNVADKEGKEDEILF